MIRPVRFALSADGAKGMHLDLVPAFMQRTDIDPDAFALEKGDPGFIVVNCTNELALGFMEGLQKMIDSPTHPPERKAECVAIILEIGRVLVNQRDAAGY